MRLMVSKGRRFAVRRSGAVVCVVRVVGVVFDEAVAVERPWGDVQVRAVVLFEGWVLKDLCGERGANCCRGCRG